LLAFLHNSTKQNITIRNLNFETMIVNLYIGIKAKPAWNALKANNLFTDILTSYRGEVHTKNRWCNNKRKDEGKKVKTPVPENKSVSSEIN